MPDSIQRIEIFLSSPGDVTERDLAEKVVKDIADDPEFRDYFSLRLYRWDDENVVLPMEATDTPQISVNNYMKKPSDCDLVVVMFWSRMGTPLTIDKQEYLSGTHYEYKDAVGARKKQGKPSVWLYRCTRKPILDMTDEDAFKKLEQFQLVNEFFKGFEDEAGRYTGGVNFYEESEAFADIFGKQLAVFLRKLKETPKSEQTHEPKAEIQEFEGKPYHGLEAIKDEKVFFGRERETLEVMTLLDQQGMVFLIGASGSGKSSLASAGVVPRLERRKGWQVIRFTPTNAPYLSLAKALIKGLAELDIAPLGRLQKSQELAQQLRESKTSLADLIDLLTTDKILLLADQFEELFTLSSDTDKTSFADLLKHDAPQIRVLATMRADFYENATPYFEKQLRQNFTLSQPSQFALYEMVTKPAELAGLRFDAGLAEQIITDLGNQAGGLALMAYLLEQLSIREQVRGDGVLSYSDYEALGGVQNAIGTHAEHIYQQLSAEANAKDLWMQRVFHELLSVDERGTATRRRVLLTRIKPDDIPFVDQFASKDARLLVKGQGTLEVAHEAIFSSWERLKGWIESIKGDLALYCQYERDAKMWDERGRDAPPPSHETLMYFYRALVNLDLKQDELPEPLVSYTTPEAARLLKELEELETTAETEGRRRDIGDRLSVIGDPRDGVGVKYGKPAMLWLPVVGSGGAEISFPETKHFIVNDASSWGQFTITDFFISKYLTTYKQYQAFVDAEDGYSNNEWWHDFSEKHQLQELSAQRTKSDNNPRDSISWYQSVAFGRWMTAKYENLELEHPSGAILRVGDNAQIRIPTEWEWQWVAMNGKDEHPYPWGNWHDGWVDWQAANTSESGLGRSIAVGMYPHGAADCDALDMAGNLYEWCLNNSDEPEIIDAWSISSKVLRGGTFNFTLNTAQSSYRHASHPYDVFNIFGCRLVVAPILF